MPTPRRAQHAEAIDDVMQARIAIERQAIRLATQRATGADIARLEEAWRRIKETMRDPAKGGDADFEFHRRVVEAAHSPTLTTLYAAIASLLRRSHAERRIRISETEGIDAYLIDHHRLILEALIERQADKADALLAQHFEIGSDFQRRAAVAELRGRSQEG